MRHLDLAQICSKSPQSSTGINRLALAHPSHGDDKKARRNVVGPLRPRSRIRTWLLVTSTKFYGSKQNHLAESRVKGLENMLHLFLGRTTKSTCKEYEDK